MKRKKLVIISHTEHYKNASGQLLGWGATINEINHIAQYWEEVVHIACLYKETPPLSALPYTASNITLAALPPFGGKTIKEKWLILTKLPAIVKTINENLKEATAVQLRLPTSIGVFLLPLFRFVFPRKYTFWVKYAGNWAQENPPWSYRLQRWWLQRNYANCNVTINGFWENQPSHCLSFENPCLQPEQLQEGRIALEVKKYDEPFVLAFVGRLDEAKGVSECIKAIKTIPIEKIAKVHFIGDGQDKALYEKQAAFLGDKVRFHGFQNSQKVHEILKASHFLLLPSKSEGFPKVIAEAACYGVVPVVAAVGSIPHYINSTNGYLWEVNGGHAFAAILQLAVATPEEELKKKAKELVILAEKFTFNAYWQLLNDKVLKGCNS